MSSGKHRQSSALDLRFDTSDIAFAARTARRVPSIAPRTPPIPARASAPTRDGDDLASGSVVAVVTEDAEAIHIHERRDTLEQPPMRRRPETVPPSPINDDPTAPMETPRDVIAAKRGIFPLRRNRP